MVWRVRLTGPAAADLREALNFSRDRFGPKQAAFYRATILAAVAELRDGPDVPGSTSRDLPTGLRSIHVARHGRRGRHFVLYRAKSASTIEILRILHDAMDLPRHIPRA